jgi:tRNA dimethylallyltransferase
MLPEPFQKALVLTGPTGSGKTPLGVELAERLDAEIIAMDSMTLYRGMDIGTAKPSSADRARVRHHLIDVLDPWQPSTVVWWLEQARWCCREIESRGKRVLLVGGTALYLKALVKGLFVGPAADRVLRDRLEREAEEHGADALHKRLGEVDPASAARLHPNNIRRVVRALEVWELTHRSLTAWQQEWSAGASTQSNAIVWLDIPRPELYRRINARVDEMIAAGLLDEARKLRELRSPPGREARQALGYKEMFDVLDGKKSLPWAVEKIKTRTRNFAKRQLTWFRNMPECRPFQPSQPQDAPWPELTFTSSHSTIL